MQPKVSIIVPAYNAETFLTRCLNSIAAQTMPDFECIIVDDGSIDKTGLVADSFAKRDTRFRVIHQKNAGVAMARQAGIDAATGVYTIQFDADDWVEANMLEELLYEAEMTNADIVICDINVITQSENMLFSQKPASLERSVVLGQIMQELHCSLCNKLIKRACYKDIHFPSGMFSEDQYVCLCLLAPPSIKVGYTSKTLYHYDQTQNPNSLTKGKIGSVARLKSLELFAASNDLSSVQAYYDRAILHIAYEVLSYSQESIRVYVKLFKKHLSSILRAKGYPFRVKLLVVLGVYGVRVPIQTIKRICKKHS